MSGVEKPSDSPIAVVMQRRASKSRWADHVWEPHGVLADPGGERARCCASDGAIAQWLHPGFKLVLHKDELEGYYLNVSAPEPRVFVLWRMEGEAGAAARRHGELRGRRPLARRRPFGRRRGDAGGDLRLGRRLRGEQLPARAEEAHQAALVPASEGPRLRWRRTKKTFSAAGRALKKGAAARRGCGRPRKDAAETPRRRCRRSTSSRPSPISPASCTRRSRTRCAARR